MITMIIIIQCIYRLVPASGTTWGGGGGVGWDVNVHVTLRQDVNVHVDKFYQPNSGLRGSRSGDEAKYIHILYTVYVYIMYSI